MTARAQSGTGSAISRSAHWARCNHLAVTGTKPRHAQRDVLDRATRVHRGPGNGELNQITEAVLLFGEMKKRSQI